jgi:hypothetical protein
MNAHSRRTVKAAVAILGIGAMGAIGSGTALAAPSLGSASGSHDIATSTDGAGHFAPVASEGGEMHSFAAPKLGTHIAEPTTRYDDNNYNDNNYDSNNGSDYRGRSSRYDNSYDANSYDSNYNNRYDNNYDNGYYDSGYRHNDNGLLGGGLLGGSN